MRFLRLLPLLLVACGPRTSHPPDGVPFDSAEVPDVGDPATEPGPDLPRGAVRFAIIGDFGTTGPAPEAVAERVHAFEPAFVLTTGDNNYPNGSAATIDAHIGQYYARYIHPYKGEYGPGADTNRFWPSPGNHEWDLGNMDPYLDYFDLPGNGRYYNVDLGLVELFSLDSDYKEPDGVTASSIQASWLREALGRSTAPWKVVYLHHPPYASGTHGDAGWMQWPWGAWGADLVWAGHEHHYERIHRHGVTYAINGIGGIYMRSLREPVEGSEVGWDAHHGATLVTMTSEEARYRTISIQDVVIDDFTLVRGRPLATEVPLVPAMAKWRYFDGGALPADDWMQPDFDDAGWPMGHGRLGYGGGQTTTVGFGGDPLDRHVTTWFRHTFTAPDHDEWDGLSLSLSVADGAIVYLNGEEVLRTNLPAGPVGPETTALTDLHALSTVTASLPMDALRERDNTLAVEVHVGSAITGFMGFDLVLEARQDDRLVPMGATWRYHDAGEAPPEGWTGVDYDDGGWAAGPAPLGWGDLAPLGTTVDFGPDPTFRHATTWYRHAFEVDDAGAVDALLMELVAADAAVIWLNGVQVYRVNVPDEVELAERERASTPLPAGWATRSRRTYLDASLLRSGTNVVAAAVRVATNPAPHHRFDLALVPFSADSAR